VSQTLLLVSTDLKGFIHVDKELLEFSFVYSRKCQKTLLDMPAMVFESLKRIQPPMPQTEADMFNTMIEFEFKQGHHDSAWQLFNRMPESIANVETFKLIFKNI